MNRKIKVFSISLAAGLLTSCGHQDGASTPHGSSPASAVELPAQKPGVWETTMKGTDIPGGSRTSSVCIDAATQAQDKATMKKYCSKNEARKEGNGWVNDSVCTIAGSHVINHSVVTPTNGDTAFRTELTSTYDPPMMGKTSSAMTIDSKWLGACQPGQKPGVPLMGR